MRQNKIKHNTKENGALHDACNPYQVPLLILRGFWKCFVNNCFFGFKYIAFEFFYDVQTTFTLFYEYVVRFNFLLKH